MNGDPYRGPPGPELTLCPHCRAQSVTVAHEALRWVCGVCGKPRVPGVDAEKLGRKTLATLRRAHRAHATLAWGRFTGIVALGVVVIPWVTLAGSFARRIMIMAAAALSAWLGGRVISADIDRRTRKLLDEAWADAAATLAASHADGVTARDLATTTRIPLADAERIVSMLSIRGARVDVQDDAEVRYRIDAPDMLDAIDVAETARRENHR